MKKKLVFKNSKMLRELAKGSINSSKFFIPYTGKSTKKKSFTFVKDEGIYIMNSYYNKNEKNKVIYAKGYNPKTNDNCWDDCRYVLGGDDFAESLPIKDEMLTNIINGGDFYLEISDDSFRYYTKGKVVA